MPYRKHRTNILYLLLAKNHNIREIREICVRKIPMREAKISYVLKTSSTAFMLLMEARSIRLASLGSVKKIKSASSASSARGRVLHREAL